MACDILIFKEIFWSPLAIRNTCWKEDKVRQLAKPGGKGEGFETLLTGDVAMSGDIRQCGGVEPRL